MNWIIFAFVGSTAQLIDGALGMGFGLTSSTLLVTLGASAAVASAAVHFAEIGTTLASGASHWHAENIDKKIFISTLLLFLGFLLLYRNVFKAEGQVNMIEIKSPRFLSYLGFTGGFVDASGGGGWGPIVTPTLISTTSMEPRKIIGTVSAAEFVVAVAASIGFLAQIGRIDINWGIVGGLALGGTIAAPIAARLVGKLPAKQLGIFVALAIIILNGVAILRA